MLRRASLIFICLSKVSNKYTRLMSKNDNVVSSLLTLSRYLSIAFQVKENMLKVNKKKFRRSQLTVKNKGTSMTYMIDFEQITHIVFDFIRGRLQFNPLNANPPKNGQTHSNNCAHFLGELTKFKVCPKAETLHFLKVCICFSIYLST